MLKKNKSKITKYKKVLLFIRMVKFFFKKKSPDVRFFSKKFIFFQKKMSHWKK